MKKIFLIFLLVIPCFLYSQEQVPETFSDGKSIDSGATFAFGVIRENYTYNSGFNKSEWGLWWGILKNKAYLSSGYFAGFFYQPTKKIENEVLNNIDMYDIDKPIADIGKLFASYDCYLNLLQGFMVQPRIGVSVSGNLLLLEYLNSKENVPDNVYWGLGVGGHMSVVSRLDIYTSATLAIFLKGEYRFLSLNYPNTPYKLKNNFTMSLGISIL